MVKLRLKDEFLMHRQRTIESFRFVKSDITNLSNSVESIKSILSSIEASLSTLGHEITEVAQYMEKSSSNSHQMESKITELSGQLDAAKSDVSIVRGDISSIELRISDASRTARLSQSKSYLLEKKIKSLGKSQRKISQRATFAKNEAKALAPRSKRHAILLRKINSSARESAEQIPRIKKLVARKVRSLRRADEELESRIKSQRKLIAKANRKIDGKAALKSSGKISRKASAKSSKSRASLRIAKSKKQRSSSKKLSKGVTQTKTAKENPLF